MNIRYLIGQEAINLFYNGKNYIVANKDLRYKKILAAIKNGDEKNLNLALSLAPLFQSMAPDSCDISIKNGKIHWHGVVMPNVISSTLISLLEEDAVDGRFKLFLDRLFRNPSKNSVDQLYKFLEYKQLPIDEDGYVIAYKGVRADYYSVHGNTSTVVLRGVVNESGRILNNVGSIVEVARNSVDDDFNNHCSNGLHVGSFDYASNWGERVLVVRFDPADAVAVPNDCNYQKLRVCKYQVVEELDKNGSKPENTAKFKSYKESKPPALTKQNENDFPFKSFEEDGVMKAGDNLNVIGGRHNVGKSMANNLNSWQQKVVDHVNRNPQYSKDGFNTKRIQSAIKQKGVTQEMIRNFLKIL